MRNSIKEILVREGKLTSQNSILVTLAAGTQEEIQVSCVAMFHDLPASMRFCIWFSVSQNCREGTCNVCMQPAFISVAPGTRSNVLCGPNRN